MEIISIPRMSARKSADILFLPFYHEKDKADAAGDFKEVKASYHAALASGDFAGKEGELLLVYGDQKYEKRILLVGLGAAKALTGERLRRAYAAAVKACQGKKAKAITLIPPQTKHFDQSDLMRFVMEGLYLANYNFSLKREASKNHPVQLIQKVMLVGVNKAALDQINQTEIICSAVHLARDLTNSNADDMTPQHLCAVAKKLASTHKHVKTEILDKTALKKEGLGLLLAVGRSAIHDPALIMVAYRGGKKNAAPVVIVGKGVTFDTGGLNLKPLGGIETMKCDMAGAAVALATLEAAATLQLPLNLVAVVPATENAISAGSYKPGDVYVGYLGKSVEIGNTDAEGRLILADALAYAIDRFAPKCIIDIATLTGAMDIALGAEATGMMSNDDKLAAAFEKAGEDTNERVWRFPLYEEYRDSLKSDIADIKNIGGRAGGAILAAIFLQEFVGKTPWVHFDIAGTAFINENKRYHPKYATGIGVRLLISFLRGCEK